MPSMPPPAVILGTPPGVSGIQSLLCQACPSRRHSRYPARGVGNPESFMPSMPPPAVILGTPPGVSGIQSLLCQACPLPPSFSAPRQGCRESRVFYAKHAPSRRHSPRPSRRRMSIPKAGLPPPAVILGTPARGVGNPESFMPSMPPPAVIPPALVAAECPYRRRDDWGVGNPEKQRQPPWHSR